jgi:C4-dicarboxylate-specific signal transduction histidine kinase
LAEIRPVTISWGNDEGGYWVTVIDRGPGPPRGDPFRLGQTTKQDHRGLGLTAAQQAMQSLGGDITLEQNESGGATAVLRWPTPEAVD